MAIELCDVCRFGNKETQKCYKSNCFDGKSFTKFENEITAQIEEFESFYTKQFLKNYNPFEPSDEHESKWFCRHCHNREREGHKEDCAYIKLTHRLGGT